MWKSYSNESLGKNFEVLDAVHLSPGPGPKSGSLKSNALTIRPFPRFHNPLRHQQNQIPIKKHIFLLHNDEHECSKYFVEFSRVMSAVQFL